MIDTIFVTVVQLSIAGGAGGILFWSLSRLLYRLTSAKVVVWFNAMILSLFVFPIYKSGERFDSSIEKFLQNNVVVLVQKSSFQETMYTVIENTPTIESLRLVWLAGMLLYLVVVFVFLRRQSRFLQYKTYSIKGSAWEKEFLALSQKLPDKQKNRISIRGSKDISDICVMGIRNRYILIPAKREMIDSKKTRKFVLQHELMHSQRNDVPLKIIMHTLNCVNWFNPIMYLLKEELNTWTEMGCDEEIVANATREQKDMYVAALMEITVAEADDEKRKQAKWSIANFAAQKDNGNQRRMKRRIRGIMRKNRKITAVRKVVAFGLMFGIVFGSSIAAKASDVKVNSLFSENVNVIYTDEFLDADNAIILNEVDNNMVEEFADVVILEENSDKIIDGSNPKAEPKHLHKFEDTMVGKHHKNSDGSCTVTYYEASYCAGCDTYWTGDIISEHSYAKCPH